MTKTAAEINNGVTATVPATPNNLAGLDAAGNLVDSLVESDGAGNITANVTGNLTGQASTIASQGALATLNSVAAGQIDANAVGESEVADSAIRFTNEMNQVPFDPATLSIANNTTTLVPAGYHALGQLNFAVSSGGFDIEVFFGSVTGWRSIKTIAQGNSYLDTVILSNGSDVRINNGTIVFYQLNYRTLFR